MSQKSGLTVRQHEREAVELSVEFVVAEPHREQVRFSAMSGAAQGHVTRGAATDISPGGVGFVCPQFVPRMCEGTVRVFNPRPSGTAADGTPVYEVMFEHPAIAKLQEADSIVQGSGHHRAQRSQQTSDYHFLTIA